MAALAAVIPLRAKDKAVKAPPSEPELHKPVQLYGLTVLAFLLHVPVDIGDEAYCTRCPEPWPCDHLRLAFRLGEAF